jgi:hypothetical protein
VTDLLLDHVAALVLGLEAPDRLPDVAAEALAQGTDSPSLRMLAAMDAPGMDQAFPILEGALRESGTIVPTPRAAALRLAMKIAQKMVTGEISAYEGSRQIWALSRRVKSESMDDLDPFIYAASEWEDRPADRVFFEDAMLRAARELTSSDETTGGRR